MQRSSRVLSGRIRGRFGRASTATMALVLLWGCASTPRANDAPEPSLSVLSLDASEAWGAIDEAEATPVVQVRDFTRARTISVLGFYKENATYGLRAEVRHDGALTTGRRQGDHRLYINRAVVGANGGFRLASIMTNELQLVSGSLRDANACILGPPCSPYENITLGIPDSVLRRYRDGLTVTFDRVTPTQWTIALSADMIAAYLNSVDSVIASRRAN